MAKNFNLKKATPYHFATDIVISPATTYAGELALPYLAPAVKLASSVANGYVTELDGITSKAVVSTLTPGTMIKASGCAWDNDPTSLTLGEKVLSTVDMMVNEQVCRGTIYPTWVATQMRGRNGAIPADFGDFLLSVVAGKTAEEIEDRIWIGGGSPTMAGFLSNSGTFNRAGLGAGALVPGASGSSYYSAGKTRGVAISAITNANIDDGLNSAYATAVAGCPGILQKDDCKFFVNQKTYGLYMQFLALSGNGQGVGMLSLNQDFNALQYLGIPVVACPGMPDDAIVLAQSSNLFFGTNLGTDVTEAKLIPFYEYDGSDNVGVAMRFAVGVQVGIPDDVVVASTAAILPA